MKVRIRKFGILSNGEKIQLFTVENNEMSFSVTNLGCTITSIIIPSKTGQKDDILLGYSTLDGLVSSHGNYYGVLVGRYANRIGKARFTLNGKEYKLDKNDGENCLHGGFFGYDKHVWEARAVRTKDGVGVRFSRTSPNGEQGFPGTVTLSVTYVLTKHNEIFMHYLAETDRDTPISLTNHAYFNLKGNGKGTILDHEVSINADSYLEVDSNLIPTGNILPVEGTPFDFHSAKPVGNDIADTNGGYDHCFVINHSKKKMAVCATVYEPVSGRSMLVATDQSGVQFYTGNFINEPKGKFGIPYNKHGAFCLETQQFPDAPNKKDFPNTILHPGDVYEATTIYSFNW